MQKVTGETDDSAALLVAVYAVLDLSSTQHQWKVRVNAEVQIPGPSSSQCLDRCLLLRRQGIAFDALPAITAQKLLCMPVFQACGQTLSLHGHSGSPSSKVWHEGPSACRK